MKTRTRMILLLSGLVGASALAVPHSLHGQAPPGPLYPPSAQPQSPAPDQAQAPPPPAIKRPPPRQNIFGTWKLNRDDSDDARQKIHQASSTNSGGKGPYGGGGGRRSGVGFPFPGTGGGAGGGGPYGGHGGSGAGNASNDEDRGEMTEFLNPPDSLTLLQKDAEVDLVDDIGRKRVFYTDGRKIQKSKDTGYQEISARWDSSRLVTDEKTVRGRKFTRTFQLAPDGQQLIESVHLDSSRSSGPVLIRFVYDIAPENKP